jgi:hypothetical protein
MTDDERDARDDDQPRPDEYLDEDERDLLPAGTRDCALNRIHADSCAGLTA